MAVCDGNVERSAAYRDTISNEKDRIVSPLLFTVVEALLKDARRDTAVTRPTTSLCISLGVGVLVLLALVMVDEEEGGGVVGVHEDSYNAVL
jgi:hypothetical protein